MHPLRTAHKSYEAKVRSKYKLKLARRKVAGLEFIPMVYWYDSTHICCTQHYKHFVFGPRKLTRGNFIEADLGQQQIKDILQGGMDAHGEYGTFLWTDGAPGTEERIVAHMDGRSFEDEHWKKQEHPSSSAVLATRNTLGGEQGREAEEATSSKVREEDRISAAAKELDVLAAKVSGLQARVAAVLTRTTQLIH